MPNRTLAELEVALTSILASPQDAGHLELIVRRPAKGQREVIDEGQLSLEEGLCGDCWKTTDSYIEAQIAIMNARSAAAIAGDRSRWALAGDQLYIDMDLSETNLPAGTQLELGSAILEITAEPHTGCSKFAARFGVEAVKFVNSARGRELNLRGLNTRVIRAGIIRKGDFVRKISRP